MHITGVFFYGYDTCINNVRIMYNHQNSKLVFDKNRRKVNSIYVPYGLGIITLIGRDHPGDMHCS